VSARAVAPGVLASDPRGDEINGNGESLPLLVYQDEPAAVGLLPAAISDADHLEALKEYLLVVEVEA